VTAHNTGGLIQTAATVHLGASVRNFWLTETMITGSDWIRETGETDGLEAENGALTVPDGPGLGVTPDPESVRSVLVDGEEYWDPA
jgi:L-alanine-DL-glutamate epimerase-like enolase superfamily enzyme